VSRVARLRTLSLTPSASGSNIRPCGLRRRLWWSWFSGFWCLSRLAHVGTRRQRRPQHTQARTTERHITARRMARMGISARITSPACHIPGSRRAHPRCPRRRALRAPPKRRGVGTSRVEADRARRESRASLPPQERRTTNPLKRRANRSNPQPKNRRVNGPLRQLKNRRVNRPLRQLKNPSVNRTRHFPQVR
jgi:hypothetical protein